MLDPKDVIKSLQYIHDKIGTGKPTREVKQIIELCGQIVTKKYHSKKQTPLKDSDQYWIKWKNAQNAQMIEYNKQTIKNKTCYMCKKSFTQPHNFYEAMCAICGQINFRKRDLKKDQTGKVAIVTGGRIKIGFYTALSLLRNNCRVIITTRFANDALIRYKAEKDCDKWIDHLEIYQVDFLRFHEVEKFVQDIKSKYKRLDYLINNAAQTIRRPPAFYKHIQKAEKIKDNRNNIKMICSDSFKHQLKIESNTSKNALINTKEYFPEGKYDEHNQQIDLRVTNTWVKFIDEIDMGEVLEVNLVNSMIPFYLNKEFKKLLEKDYGYSWIINVSSMEGKFTSFKTGTHPHTNMAKASLNMMTRTCSKEYFKHNIVMCSVDTGWNTVEHPKSYHLKSPIDCVDGATRILDPVYRKLKRYGIFYKDFRVVAY